MANKIGVISPIKKQHDTANGQIKSLGSSLQEHSLTMHPGTSKRLTPFKEKNGEYRTGLDENALYIKKMTNPAEQEQEKARVRSLLKDITDLTNLDLGPRSDYYSKMWEYRNSDTVASDVALTDRDNIFRLDDIQQAITFAWLRVHPDIAPSYDAWRKGYFGHRCPAISQCQFFVNDLDYENKVEYETNTKIDRASNLWYNMNPIRRRKVATLLNFPITRSTTDEAVYNEGKRYLDSSKSSVTQATNIENFFKIAEMTDENIEVRFKVKQGFEYNIYRKSKNQAIYEIATDEKIADNEQELVEFLSSKKNNEHYLALIKKIETAQAVEV